VGYSGPSPPRAPRVEGDGGRKAGTGHSPPPRQSGARVPGGPRLGWGPRSRKREQGKEGRAKEQGRQGRAVTEGIEVPHVAVRQVLGQGEHDDAHQHLRWGRDGKGGEVCGGEVGGGGRGFGGGLGRLGRRRGWGRDGANREATCAV
jgi:hypothetical protein